jgi:hypothetical protein
MGLPKPEKPHLLAEICESGNQGLLEIKKNQDERAMRLILENA